MAIKFEKLKVGEVYYDRARTKMGNTTLSCLSEWRVKILEIDLERRTALVSWNSNRPEKWYERRLRSLFDWSMYDPTVAETTCVFGRVSKVRKKKPEVKS